MATKSKKTKLGHDLILKAEPSEAKLGHDPILSLPLSNVRPSPENDRLYKPVRSNDPDIIDLAKSITEHGIQEPLILSRDNYIISGHRRYAAARRAGLQAVSCRIREDVSRADDHGHFLRLLRECNRQRNKTLDEKLREEIVSLNPEETYSALVEHRQRQAAIKIDTMELGEYKRRATISDAKQPLLEAIKRVIEERKDYCPLSDRQIHYALLNDPPLIHAKKPDSIYRNDKQSYKSLVELLARARVAMIIPFHVISDETRPIIKWQVWPDSRNFIREQLNGLFMGYWRNPLQSQPNHIELVIEKNTALSILKPVASRYGLPVTSGRGYCSLPPRHEIYKRHRNSGKEKLILLVASDFDPDGESIASSFARSMRDDFGVREVEAVKVALTAEQVRQFNIPPQMIAKAGCATRKAFVEKHGENVYELEALNPKDLQELTRKAIESVLDMDAFNHEVDEERQESVFLAEVREKIMATVGEVA